MFQQHWLKQRNTATLQHIWLNLCAVYCKTFSAWYVSTHGGWDIAKGVVVNFDLRERFPTPRSQQRGACAPRTACSRAWGECGRGSPPPIFWDFWYQMGQKINWSRVNLTSTTWFAGRFSVSVPPVANDICRSTVPAPKYLPEQRSTAFPHHYTPGYCQSSSQHRHWKKTNTDKKHTSDSIYDSRSK